MRRAAVLALGRVQKVQGVLLGLIMLAITFGYAANVLVRDLAPALAPRLAWMDEMALFGLVWMVFLALGLGLESGRHIGMRMLTGRLPPGAGRAIRAAVNLTGLILSLYMIRTGIRIAVFVSASGQASPTLGISTGWLYLALPVGFGLLAVQYLFELLGWTDRFARAPDPAQQA